MSSGSHTTLEVARENAAVELLASTSQFPESPVISLNEDGPVEIDRDCGINSRKNVDEALEIVVANSIEREEIEQRSEEKSCKYCNKIWRSDWEGEEEEETEENEEKVSERCEAKIIDFEYGKGAAICHAVLNYVGAGEYFTTFANHHITPGLLKKLTEQDFIELGVTDAQRRFELLKYSRQNAPRDLSKITLQQLRLIMRYDCVELIPLRMDMEKLCDYFEKRGECMQGKWHTEFKRRNRIDRSYSVICIEEMKSIVKNLCTSLAEEGQWELDHLEKKLYRNKDEGNKSGLFYVCAVLMPVALLSVAFAASKLKLFSV